MKNYRRLFVAAPLPENYSQQLDPIISAYEKPGVRIVPAENRHITIHFIGNVAETKVQAIIAGLQNTMELLEAFTLKPVRTAPGPQPKLPRLVWLMFEPNKAFEKAVRKTGFALAGKAENQHPLPHITLARLAKDFTGSQHLPVLPATGISSLEVNTLSLWESDLGGAHPKYTVLETFAFGKSK